MSFSEERKKAFDFCADATKQLITLATGIIALTITFAKDFVTNVPEVAKCFAYWSWGFYGASIVAGMFTLLAMTAELEPASGPVNPTIRKAVATWSLIQLASFGIAIILTVCFGVSAARNSNTESKAKETKVVYLLTCDTANMKIGSLKIDTLKLEK